LVTSCVGTAFWNVIEGKIEGRREVTGRRGRRCKQLLDDLKEKRGYCKLKEEALDSSLWRTGCGRVYGPVVRRPTDWMIDCDMFRLLYTAGVQPLPSTPRLSSPQPELSLFLALLSSASNFSCCQHFSAK
jgi:hypothetical protein